jgi:hypothetical protein
MLKMALANLLIKLLKRKSACIQKVHIEADNFQFVISSPILKANFATTNHYHPGYIAYPSGASPSPCPSLKYKHKVEVVVNKDQGILTAGWLVL